MDDRAMLIAAVLESVAGLGRELTAAHATPFGDVHLGRTQLDALFVLAHATELVTPGSLAAALTVTPGAVTQLVDGLRSHGLVETTLHPDDGRARVIRLTGDARDQVDRFERAAAERLAPRFDPLDDDELRMLSDLLERASHDGH